MRRLWSVEELDGMFIGLLEPEEYEAHLESGVLTRSYEGVGGLLGLAKLRISKKETCEKYSSICSSERLEE